MNTARVGAEPPPPSWTRCWYLLTDSPLSPLQLFYLTSYGLLGYTSALPLLLNQACASGCSVTLCIGRADCEWACPYTNCNKLPNSSLFFADNLVRLISAKIIGATCLVRVHVSSQRHAAPSATDVKGSVTTTSRAAGLGQRAAAPPSPQVALPMPAAARTPGRASAGGSARGW